MEINIPIRYNGQDYMPAHNIRIRRLIENGRDSSLDISCDNKPLLILHDVGGVTIYTDFSNVQLNKNSIRIKKVWED